MDLKVLLDKNSMGLLVVGTKTLSPQQYMQTRMAKTTMAIR
jgi:hypothetical protein